MVKVFIAGHQGMVGSAIHRQLALTNAEVITASRDELDLTNQVQVETFFEGKKVDQIYLAAAKVGGIHANNTYPADFIYQNLMIQNNIIHSAYCSGVKKLLFLGSSCIYPKLTNQPMSEAELLSGCLEPTNEPYAIAKIAGIKMCESYNRQYGVDYRSIMPSNLFGPGDNFHPENSHVIPALINRFHEAKLLNSPSVQGWGSGKPRREFLHVNEMAEASMFVMNLDSKIYKQESKPMISHINVGTGKDYTIKELAETIAKVVGYLGDLKLDDSKPDGSPRKLMDISLLRRLGWESKGSLEEGLKQTYEWFLANQNNFRK